MGEQTKTAKSERVYIRRQPNHWEIGYVSFDDLQGLRFDTLSGGYGEITTEEVYGYVWCDKIVGQIGHSCLHGEGPHKIKVCILQEDNTKKKYRQVLSFVGVL